VDSWMARDPARMTPLEDLSPHRVGDKQPVRGTVAWIGLGQLGPPDHPLDVYGDHPHDAGRRENGLRLLGARLRFVDAGKGVRLGVSGPGTEGEGELESAQELSPSCLAGVEASGRTDVGEVLMVGPDQGWMLLVLR